MFFQSPSPEIGDNYEIADKLIEKTDLTMTKSYQRFRLYSPNNSGFIVGLADFACLGWGMYDLAGYPYDDENAALFADWVRLGEDVESAKKKFEKAKTD